MSTFDIFKTMPPPADEREESIIRRIRANVAREIAALPSHEGPRPASQIKVLLARLRLANGALWRELGR